MPIRSQGNTGARAFAAWTALGSFIGAHLMAIVPAGVAIGVLFPQVLLPLKPFVPLFFAVMTFQNSLSNDLPAMRRALRRPLLPLAVLGMVHVAMPLLVFGVATLVFGAGSPTVAGVVLEYSVPIGASAIMWVGMFGGDLALGLATLLASTVLSPFSIPLTLKLLVGTTVEIDALSMMGNMAYMVAIPALVATVLNEASRGWCQRVAAPATTPVSRLLLPVIVATNATGISEPLHHLTPRLVGIMLLMLAFAVGSFCVGMLVARRLSRRTGDAVDKGCSVDKADPVDKPFSVDKPTFVSLSFCCGIRNVTAGAVLATQYFGPEVLFPAIIATPFQQVLAAAFGRIMERALARGEKSEA